MVIRTLEEEKLEKYLKSTPIIDSDNGSVINKAQELTKGLDGAIEKAKALFYFVRDKIRYNIYVPKYPADTFRASETLNRGQGYCVQKAVLLVTLARAVGIPARLNFAKIRNNLISPKLYKVMKGNIFPWHGYAELYLQEKWVKATPTFDLKMCQKHGIIPVEFDGQNDARFNRYNEEGKLHIEYLKDYGPYDDVPFEEIWQALGERGLVEKN